eukprot:GFUD01008355.1.p1 GENE.GFUD01008355.1~~GFUD01008355.1.p1  ORF type:complete len:1621 (+),score=387.09 GFUD01008355.1:109-4971(+)
MGEHQPTPHHNSPLSSRGVTHDLRTGSLLVSHADNTEDATNVTLTELDQINSEQQDTRNTAVSAQLGVSRVNGSSLSLTSSTESVEKKKRGLFKQLSLNLQYGTFNKDPNKVANTMVAGLSLMSALGFIQNNDAQGLQAFLQNDHVEIDESDEDGWSAIFYAIAQDKPALVQVLIELGANVNKPDSSNGTPLLQAAKGGNVQICKDLLAAGALADCKDNDSWTPLLVVCYVGYRDILNVLVGAGADVNDRGQHHCSGLTWACGKGYTEIARTLLEQGSRVDFGDKYGTTPLIWASRAGHVEIVADLLRFGAKVDTTGMYAWSALVMAAKGNHTDVVHLLLQQSTNVNIIDKDGQTALAIACKEGNLSIIHKLLGAGAYVNLQDRAGDTNLIIASKAGHVAVVDILIKRHAEVDTRGKESKTALFNAVEKNHTEVVRILLAVNPDIEIASSDGNTALLRAVKNRNPTIVRLLIDKKAKLNAADEKGDTALHVAMRAGSKTIVELLLRNPKHSQLLYKPNCQGETPYNIDLANQKPILSQLFGSRKLNTNEDSENMLGYDLYGSALADILSEPSLSMPITVGLYAKWGSGKSFLLNKLQAEMKNFSREWTDPAFQFTPLVFLIISHLTCLIGLLSWTITHFMKSETSFLVLLLVMMGTLAVCYGFLFTVNQDVIKSEFRLINSLNMNLAKLFSSLELITKVLFCQPPGSSWRGRQDQASPLRLFFTDQTKVSTSAGGDNSVVQMIGSLYDSIENTYGKTTTRLYRAFRPAPVSSTSGLRLKKFCCVPYAVIYLLSFILLIAEIVVIIMSTETKERSVETILRPDHNLSLSNMNNVPRRDIVLDTNYVDNIVHYLLIVLSVILGIILLSNVQTFVHIFKSLFFSQRSHLQRAVANQDLVKSEGYLQAVKKEIDLLKNLVKTLDAFTNRQSRMIIIVDGLDSVEQKKVLQVLDTVHTLFSDAGSPFIILLAIDPHVITKAIELNLNEVFSDTSIGGYAYLRNMVHLPFFLQNAGFRKIKIAQTLSLKVKNELIWTESEINLGNSQQKLGADSHENMLGRVNSSARFDKLTGPLEVNRMFLTDDYFSDVNPRSMRRLMNVIYVIGRLLKAFNIDFNWHHLASWTNITEQWPYRTSWIINYAEHSEERLDNDLSLKALYDKIKMVIPKRNADVAFTEMDRDEQKLEIFLMMHKKTLTVKNLKIFLPFTINLDPYIKKLIKEEIHNMEALGVPILSTNGSITPSLVNRTPVTLQKQRSNRSFTRKRSGVNSVHVPTHSFPFSEDASDNEMYTDLNELCNQPLDVIKDLSCIPNEFKSLPLSSLVVAQVCDLVKAVDGISVEKSSSYCTIIKNSNINGKVLQNCDISELRTVIGMNFGDWEMFKMTLIAMRTNLVIPESLQAINNSEPIAKNLNREDEKRILTHRDSVIKQVAMEEEAVSGLLAFINEDAREDYIQEEEDGEAVTDVTAKANPQEVDCIYYSNIVRSVQDVHALSDSMGHVEQGQRGGLKQMNAMASLPKVFVNGEDIKYEDDKERGPHVWIGHGSSSPYLRKERSSSFFSRERSQSECPDIEELEEKEPTGVRSLLNKSMTKIFENRKKKQNRNSFPGFYLEPSDSVLDMEELKDKK